MNLYDKKHNNLNICILDAIKFDGNCEMYDDTRPEKESKESSVESDRDSSKSKVPIVDKIVYLIIKKMNQVFRPLKRP